MRKSVILSGAALFALSMIAAPAMANEAEDGCKAYLEEQGGEDNGGCKCLGKKADKDDALASALAAITSPEDLEAADKSTKDEIAACFPDA